MIDEDIIVTMPVTNVTLPGGKHLQFASSVMVSMSMRYRELEWHDVTNKVELWSKSFSKDWTPEAVLTAMYIPYDISKHDLWKKVKATVTHGQVAVYLGGSGVMADRMMTFYFEKLEDAALVKLFHQ